MCLVLVEHLVPEGGCLLVEGDGIVGGFKLAYRLEQDKGKAINSAHHLPGPAHRQWRQGMEGAMHQSIAIKQHQTGLFHSLIIAEFGDLGGIFEQPLFTELLFFVVYCGV